MCLDTNVTITLLLSLRGAVELGVGLSPAARRQPEHGRSFATRQLGKPSSLC
jgi:hypothetical protein